uniref:Dirigent protein n=1 Tax=Setaria viridis TaxID=4556 RepID=A0A4U6VDD4_SETVI|nr:dirigent protein 1-like [Setaria viridis]TKW26555.1 hypothetical protein SEVIR_3G197800v2 [Setaria viridis]
MAAAPCPSLVLVLLLICSCAAADGELIHHLHFYFHEVDTGTRHAQRHLHQRRQPAPARVRNTPSASTFGDVNVFDDELREGPDPASRLIGRARGLAAHASLDESGGLSAVDFDRLLRLPAALRFARGYMHDQQALSATDTAIVVVFDIHVPARAFDPN